MHDDGTIWTYTGTPITGWQQVDDNPRARAIKAFGLVAQVSIVLTPNR